MTSQSEIMDLSMVINANVKALNDYLEAEHLPQPSLGVDAPPTMALPPHLMQAKTEILVAMDELKALLQGPTENLVQLSSPTLNTMPALDACVKFKIAQSLKIDEEITYQELSRRCGMGESDLSRIMRMLISMRVFDEPRKGFVRHNGSSKILHENERFADWLGYATQTIWPSSFFMVDAIQKFPHSQELDQTAFHLLRGNTFWDWLNQDSVGTKRFRAAMEMLQTNPMFGSHHLVNSLGWNQANCPKLMVDVGGHDGEIGSDILHRYPTIKYIIQDLPAVIAAAQTPDNLRGRLEFQSHDFFTPQPVQADVYLLRSILHDWPDKYAQKIIWNLMPALKPGAKVIVNEVCMPDPGVMPKHHESNLRGYDLCMKQFFNSRERDLEQWIALFRGCDGRFRFNRLEVPPGSALALIEFVWD